jgi:signal transduction histidine kinase
MQYLIPRQAGAPAGASPRGAGRRWGVLVWVTRHPTLVAIALDSAGVALIVATFLGYAHPDLNFHIVWVLLALHAFFFDLRTTSLRIVAATASLIAYTQAYQAGMVPTQLDLIEWPLMFVISVIVAVLAEWRNGVGRHYANLYRLTADHLIGAQEAERKRLSMNLHDGVGQTLTALGLTLEALAGRERSDRATLISHGRALLATAVAETREVAERLRPSRIGEVGLMAALQDLASRAGMPVRLVSRSGMAASRRLAPETAVAAFRIVQEALNNVARHASAAQTVIDVSSRGRWLVVEVSDDGIGFDLATPNGYGRGLAGMYERASMMGGQLAIESAATRGTTVRVSIPVPAAGDAWLGIGAGVETVIAEAEL